MVFDLSCIQLNDKCFMQFVALVYDLTRITIGESRKSMVQGRLRKRLRELQFDQYETYYDYLVKTSEEQTTFINLMTTNETSFLRTPRIWNYILEEYFPQWLKSHGQETLNIWSAAASSGEEAHTLAILCHHFKEQHPQFNYQILGSDISTQMIEECERGHFSEKSISTLRLHRPDLFKKYITQNDETYHVRADVRSKLRFKQHNLFKPLKLAQPFDLVLLRNVLIYFNQKDQERLLDKIHHYLSCDGQLIIGESESLSHIKTPFLSIKPLIYKTSSAQKIAV